METKLSSASKEVIIGKGRPTVLIGERINPSGKKAMSEALKTGDLEIIRKEALNQVAAKADVLDVNVSTYGVNEVELLPRVVKLVMETVDIPLCIDSANAEAMLAALKVYKGKALINSITGEGRSLSKVLPMVKEFNTAVIALPQDEQGIPGTASRRLEIACKIVERAENMGIARENILIDCLALSIGAEPESLVVALETAASVHAELGINTAFAVSNISYGLPDRSLINHAAASAVISGGINCLIVDVAKLRPIILAADVVVSRDHLCRRYIEAFRERQKAV